MIGTLEYIIIVAIVVQLLFTWQIINNHRYARKKYCCPRENYRPICTIIVPCKGIDRAFEENISSFFQQNYENYNIRLVVESQDDLAYERLTAILEKNRESSSVNSAEILVAGKAESSSQKLHNLLFAYNRIPQETEILVFADSDACANINWLSHIVYPLHTDKTAATTGYRWFVPLKNNLATLALSAINAKIFQMLGKSRFNLAWGGSMAISVENFRDMQLDKIWRNSLSDDLSLSVAVRKTGKKIAFIPAAMVASYEKTSWPQLFEFARRQFVITRIYAPITWTFGLCSASFAVIGLWAGLALAIWSLSTTQPYTHLYIALPAVFFICQLTRAVLRQNLITKLLPSQKRQLAVARIADICLFWLWSIILLAFIITSAVGRTIKWRNITYKLNSPSDIEILN